MTTVAIELLYDRIDVAAVIGGRVAGVRRISASLPAEPGEWAAALRGAAEPLRRAVAELSVAGRPAAVLYRSPTQSVDLASFELRRSSEASSAAVLACAESLPYPLSSAVVETAVLGRDRTGSPRRTHVVVAADREDTMAAIVEAVESAGLRFATATPLDAATLALLLRRALRDRGPRRGWLHFGENSSFFLLAGKGAVGFDRVMGIGFRTLAAALTRPIRVPESDEEVELSATAARDILFRHGIPESDAIVYESPPLGRRHIMPLMQPLLQRYVIELRQSLRFGLVDEKERGSVGITVTGPGASIPGFAALLEAELGLRVEPRLQDGRFDYALPAGPGGELRAALRSRGLLAALSLQPVALAERREQSSMRRALWAGGVTALLAVGGERLLLWAQRSAAERCAAAMRFADDGVERLGQTRQRLIGALGAMAELERTIEQEVGPDAPPWAAMAELGRITPESVRVTSMRFGRESGAVVGRVNGRAAAIDPGGKTMLEPYLEALRRSPLLEDIVLRGVEIVRSPEAGQRFDLDLRLVGTPRTPEGLAAAGGAP
jgi:Tfp pilus assembly PilM family ATPase